MKNETKKRQQKLAGITEIFNQRPEGMVTTVGELKKEIENLPDEMKLTTPDGPDVTLFVFEGMLTISTR